MLTRLRNAKHGVPRRRGDAHSKIKAESPNPQAGGVHRRLARRGREVGKTLILDLKFARAASARSPAVRRVSKPGLPRLREEHSLPRVLGGLGVAINLDVVRLLTEQAGIQEGRGWGSPRLRLVAGRREQPCRASDACPSPFPRESPSTSTAAP